MKRMLFVLFGFFLFLTVVIVAHKSTDLSDQKNKVLSGEDDKEEQNIYFVADYK